MAIDRATVPDQVVNQFAAAVLSGRYEPGERLPGQRALASELGVNMASLREGIKRLQQMRLIDVRHGDAMRVLDWRATGGLDVLAYAATADPGMIGHLFEARRLLLREAARLAAQRRDDGQAQRLGDIADRIASSDGARTSQLADLEFFATLIESSGNLVFTLILNSIRALYLERMEIFAPMMQRLPELAPLYADAARAVRDGDADAAAAAVEAIAAEHEERMLG